MKNLTFLFNSFFPSVSLSFLFSVSVCSPHPWGTLLEPAFVNYKLSVLYIAVVKDQLINHFIEDLEDSFHFYNSMWFLNIVMFSTNMFSASQL